MNAFVDLSGRIGGARTYMYALYTFVMQVRPLGDSTAPSTLAFRVKSQVVVLVRVGYASGLLCRMGEIGIRGQRGWPACGDDPAGV